MTAAPAIIKAAAKRPVTTMSMKRRKTLKITRRNPKLDLTQMLIDEHGGSVDNIERFVNTKECNGLNRTLDNRSALKNEILYDKLNQTLKTLQLENSGMM